jgi:hypothetical protein
LNIVFEDSEKETQTKKGRDIISTKHLARTVLEAARSKADKFKRRQIRRKLRHEYNDFCRQAKFVEYENIDDVKTAPLPAEPLMKRAWYERSEGQEDSLGPIFRWLQSKAGQQWDDVYSELRQKFCQGGVAESHIVDDHMLFWIAGHGYNRFDLRNPYFVIDEDGVLRQKRNWSGVFGYSDSWKPPRKIGDKTRQWLNNRKIRKQGTKLYWLEKAIRLRRLINRETREWVYAEIVNWRQGKPLSKKDIHVFRSLHAEEQRLILEESTPKKKAA